MVIKNLRSVYSHFGASIVILSHFSVSVCSRLKKRILRSFFFK